MTRALGNKEQQILAAAQPLFARFGFRKTTIDDIAQAAGLGKGTIYLYFKSKEEIFAAFARLEVDEFYTRLNELVGAEASHVDKLRVYVHERLRAVFRIRAKNAVTVEAFFDAKVALELMPLKTEFKEREDRFIRGLVEAGVVDGTFQVPDVEIFVRGLRSALEGLEDLLCQTDEEYPLEGKVDSIMNLLLNGVCGKRGAIA